MNSYPITRCADALVEILEVEGVEFIFGHPGEHILPLYDALRNSSIKHVLMRHEQGAAHAADGYARASGNIGVCMASAGPGALNLAMGVATAYKDSIPLLVITGDVSTDLQGGNIFQEIDVGGVFKPITLESFHIQESEDGVLKLKKAFKMLKYGRTGPLHLNFPKDVLKSPVGRSVLESGGEYSPKTDFSRMKDAIKIMEEAKRPLILSGAGVIWAGAVTGVKNFAEIQGLPVATTYPARGVLPEDHPLCVGMIGLRGTDAANYAGEHCDVLMGLGCKFSERTLAGIGDCKIIHVNLDQDVLRGDVKILGDVSEFIKLISSIKSKSRREWLAELAKHKKHYDIKTDYNEVPIKPQRAIKEILDAAPDSTVVNDAGTHTTWVTLLKNVKRPLSLIFSGGFGPMGYGVPAAIGTSLADPLRGVVVITGDGGFQMTLQELAVITEKKLPILICIINNSSLAIIKQWQELYYEGSYQVELENPDFVELTRSYHIDAERVDSPRDVFETVKKAVELRKPYLIDIAVDREERIPLPKVMR